MAFICLPKEKVEQFKKALKGKELNVFELMKMSTEKRTAIFEEFAGKDASRMNLLFEEKLILKNRVQGIKNWMSKLGELGKYDPAKKAELEALFSEYRERQQERIFNPQEHEAFLSDLAAQEAGVRMTGEQAKISYELSKKADDYFSEYDKATETWKSPKAQADYGASVVTAKKYINNLKEGNLSVKGMLKEYGKDIKEIWKENKYEATKKIAGDAIYGLSKMMINAVASWDNSFLGRQGGITLMKNPKVWWNMAKKSMSDFYQTLKGQDPQDVLMAELYSDVDYINGNYERAKISFGIEEEIPINLLEKTPVISRIFKASDISFIDSAIRARMGLFKVMKKVYEAKKIPLDDVLLRDIGTHINAITARGKVGMFLGSKPTQLLLWAPKMMKADWDILTAHTFGFGLKTKTVRIEAAKTIFNVVVVTAAVVAIAKAMGAEVETDPRSTDFLAIKVGNTRIKAPFTRGMTQIVTLFSRLLTQKTKNSAGIITKLNSGEYGSRTLFDVGIDFLANKTTPPVSAVIDWLEGRDFAGKKPTIGTTAFGFLPISVQNFIQLKDDDSTAAVIGAFLDLFGISSNTYSIETDWEQGTGVTLQQFREKVGDKKFKEANDLYNKRISDWLNSVKKNQEYLELSEDDKQQLITNKKTEIKNKIFKEYDFKYESQSKKLPKL